jgi:hypothetical protein
LKNKVKTQINDIRIKSRGKESTGGTASLLRRASGINFDEVKGLINPTRRNFLKIVVASGGIFLAGSVLNKVNKLSKLSLAGQSGESMGSVYQPRIPDSIKNEELEDDLESFFENFSIVKNDKEYVLYNKEGDNILIIDRDA